MKLFTGVIFAIVLSFFGLEFDSAEASANTDLVPVSDSLPKGWSEIDFKKHADIINRMAYADTANFMHQKLYPCARCMLRPEVAEALINAEALAAKQNLKLVIFDCYRPYALQYKMYEMVNDANYVAKPGSGSKHNRGAAVDLSLADFEGNLLDMGGNFDDFTEVSHYTYKGLSEEAVKNRKLLRNIMTEAGFSPYDKEWWHFDYNKKLYDISVYVWECDEETQE